MATFDDSKQLNFDSVKANKGSKPYDNPTGVKPSGAGANQSNQERGTGEGERKITPDASGTFVPNNFRAGVTGPADKFTDTNRRGSEQARFNPNTEVPTDTLKNPLNSYLRKVLPAVQNPDEGNDRSYSRKAAGRVVGSKRSL